jgi:hypothetical protein
MALIYQYFYGEYVTICDDLRRGSMLNSRNNGREQN